MILFLQKYRVVALAVLMMSMAIGGAAIGASVNGWRLEAAHQLALAAKDKEIAGLTGKLAEQNASIALLGEKTEAAEARRQLAELFASGALERAGNRAAAVSNSKATTCDGVLREAWEGWK